MANDDDPSVLLSARAEDAIVLRRWGEAADLVRAGQALLERERPHRSKALFGCAGDAAALGAAAEAAEAATTMRPCHPFPGFERGRVLIVEPTGDDEIGTTAAASAAAAQDKEEARAAGGTIASVASALSSARDGDVLLLRPGTHRLTCPRTGDGLVVDKRVMIAADACLNPNTTTTTTTRLYHCGNSPALRLRRPCVVRGVLLETDGFREAVLVEVAGAAGRERLRAHARLGLPLVLLWGCEVRCGGDDAVHVVGGGEGGGAGGGEGIDAGGPAAKAAAAAASSSASPPAAGLDDALLVECRISAPSSGKSALVLDAGATVRVAQACALGPCGGSGAMVLGSNGGSGPSSSLTLKGPKTTVEDCGADGVAAVGSAELTVRAGVVVRRCGGFAADASGAAAVVRLAPAAADNASSFSSSLGQGCKGGALALWDGATAFVDSVVELLGEDRAFAVVVAGSGCGGGVVASSAAAARPVVRGDAFVALSTTATSKTLLRLGARKVLSEKDDEGRARLPSPAAADDGDNNAFAAPPTRPRFTPLSFG